MSRLFVPRGTSLFVLVLFFVLSFFQSCSNSKADPRDGNMLFIDTTYTKEPFAKDENIVKFNGKYFMYYSAYYPDKEGKNKLCVGIAESDDLVNWTRVSQLLPEQEAETDAICAPGAIIRNDTLHLFYQSYGNFGTEAICHATSVDGLNFEHDPSNPVFTATGDWNCGRAIDAEVVEFDGKYFMYFATRDPQRDVQMQGVATANKNSGLHRGDWKLELDATILKPELPWEGKCIEGATTLAVGNTLYMFYAGAYNRSPQMIGVASSKDGVNWKRLSDEPFLRNGEPGSWNEEESGHPDIFKDEDGRTWLFYQGYNSSAKSWEISKIGITWDEEGKPVLNLPAEVDQED
ncbi:MAG: family 43 glycosylhydrolase [Bacteroidales bacterium]|nr:family 43 glycosylhydrolase [Bacteroidales bacterium]